jgi:hypothetical protein
VFTVRFGSVFIKKSNQTEFFFKKKTETEPKPVQTDRFRFGSLEKKPVQTGLARFWLGFFSLARFFSGFFLVRFGSVFLVPGLKNQNRTEPVGFFKILIGLIGFFLRFGFFGYFFSGFLGLIGFSVFLNAPIWNCGSGDNSKCFSFRNILK